MGQALEWIAPANQIWIGVNKKGEHIISCGGEINSPAETDVPAFN
jgi:hypothetical protein